MSTIEVNKTDPADKQAHSESELAIIGDMTVWYQMPYLSARRLIQLNCKRWSVWNPYHIKRISEARRLDDSRDWYFPIIVHKRFRLRDGDLVPPALEEEFEGEVIQHPPVFAWFWSGIWHSAAHHASERVHTLPPMTHLPHEWLHYSLPRGDIIASACGLLLIKSIKGVVPQRRSRRLNPHLADPKPMSVSGTTTLPAGTSSRPANGLITSKLALRWKRLLVCNPLTRECRELPAANCQLMGFATWEQVYSGGVQAMMVVDEEANCYQVILTFEDFVAVYTSTTNSWNCLRFPAARPWARLNPHFASNVKWGYHCASAHVDGRLIFADVQSTAAHNASMFPTQKATTAGNLRLYKVDAEAGQWHLLQEYTLRKFHIPYLNGNIQEFSFDMGILPYIDIVECMGDLYAIIPAKFHDVWLVGEKQTNKWRSEVFDCVDELGTELEYMPLCFYIMQLQGHGEDHGVLRIQVPRTRSDFQSRSRLLRCLSSQCCWFLDNWFSCDARGSVIWVSCEDYLLSYDVVSRESKTQIIPLGSKERLGIAYRPSFHMKP